MSFLSGLKNKNIVVTGASRGIGAGIARILAARGARVAITYSNNEKKAQEVLSDLEGSNHFALQMDITNEESIKAGFVNIFSKMTTVDGLVNNAGVTEDMLLLMMKTDSFDKVISTNLRGTFLTTKSVLKPMLKAKKGSIVNITSVVGEMGNPGQANYAASKAGVEAFTKSVAREMAGRNIRLNCVAPGYIVTEMTEQLSLKQKETIIGEIPMQTLGSALDVAYAVAFLLSDESNYITGQTIRVNGGLYM
ncbi:MAG: 3-oxoacyl-[acyl-carrier-protein] reductase [Pseudomonadota bacterium]|nr:3-oxoacyl-[acyl-carrier-protein] reductase [Pseudomonadota bacterium]